MSDLTPAPISKEINLCHEDHVEDAKDDKRIEFSHNVNARVCNPLLGIPKSQLLEDVAAFCAAYGLSDKLEVFEKGAIVAQSVEDFENIPELNEDDKMHLRRETTHKWHLSRTLYYTIAICSLGSALQGWDNTAANGANLSFPREFGIEDNTWLVGLINSAPTISGLFATWLADPLNNWMGRRGVIFFTALFCVFPVLGQAFTQNWWSLLICRLVMGFGMAIKITTIPIMTSEIVPASIRGGLVMSFQLWVAFGIFTGFSFNLIFYRIGPLAWRFQMSAAFAPAVPILILIWFCPESPRWLLKKHRIRESFASFRRLRTAEILAARDLYYAYSQYMVEESVFGGSSFRDRFIELFKVPRIRRASYGAALVMMAQQFSGMGIMSFYSSTVFSQAGSGTLATLMASWGFGLVNFIFAFPAIWTIDTFGRRNLLLLTFPNMAWCLIAGGFCFFIPGTSGARLPLIAFFVYLFTAFYSPGIGPVPNVYAAECFPLSHREIGSALAIFVNNTLSTILSLTFPSILAAMSPTGAFGFYAGLNMLAFVLIFFLLPETKQRTLEELDYIFAVPTKQHAAYYGGTWFPWAIKRYLLFQRKTQLKPLYHLEGFTSGSKSAA